MSTPAPQTPAWQASKARTQDGGRWTGSVYIGDPAKMDSQHFADVYADSREELEARLAQIAASPALLEALQQSAECMRLVNSFLDDLQKSNPGWIGKLCLQRYDVMNEAFMALERVPRLAKAAIAAAQRAEEGA